jgi:hypothetical protein
MAAYSAQEYNTICGSMSLEFICENHSGYLAVVLCKAIIFLSNVESIIHNNVGVEVTTVLSSWRFF